MERPKKYLPVFVSSTYDDLKNHRQVVRETLHRIGVNVKGMEDFGAQSSRPKDVCIKEVTICKIYIGIIAMRYGNIDSETEKSFTHLEYETAIKHNLKVLIYLIDENQHHVLPIHIDTNEKSKKLQEFKEQLKEKHTIQFFSSPEQLALKINQDIERVIDEFSQYENRDAESKEILESIDGNVNISQIEIYKSFIEQVLADKNVTQEENIILNFVRRQLNISIEDALQIEEKVLKLNGFNAVNIDELAHKHSRSANEITGSADRDFLNMLKQEHLNEKLMVAAINDYLDIDNSNSSKNVPLLFRVSGCWQGWYSQYKQKTFVDYVFIVKNENQLIGKSIEPVNPTWARRFNGKKILIAEIEGRFDFSQTAVISCRKTYTNIEDTWSIDYEGVLLDGESEIEGDWNISNYRIFGLFNAVKSKSLLPLRIQSTITGQSIVNTIKNLSQFSLDGLWVGYIRIGKEKRFLLINFLVDYKKSIFANICRYDDFNKLKTYYAQGNLTNDNNIILKEVHCLDSNIKEKEENLLFFNAFFNKNDLTIDGKLKTNNQIGCINLFKV